MKEKACRSLPPPELIARKIIDDLGAAREHFRLIEAVARRVWVLNPKALPAFLGHQKPRLAVEGVALASTHLAKCIRAGEARGCN